MTNPYDDIRRERVRQDEMHGPRLDVNDIPRVLGEEFGEVCKAINDREGAARIREELVQCAAVCLKAIESIDRGDAMPPSERSGFVVHDPSKQISPTDEMFCWPINSMWSKVSGNLLAQPRSRPRDVGFPFALLVKGGDE